MGLSNYVPNSRLAQPGVCTSTTRPATPYEGQVIYETDTNRVLVWDASAWVMIADTDAPPGLQLVKTVNVGSSVATVEVTDCFSTDYQTYRVVISNVWASTASAMTIKLGTLTTEYYGTEYYDQYTGSITGASRTSSGSVLRIAEIGTNEGRTVCSFDIGQPFAAQRTALAGNFYGGAFAGWFGGENFNAASVTGFTLGLLSTHTFGGGTIRVYGYRNS